MDLADNCQSDPTFYQTLDTLERGLLKDAVLAGAKLNAWLIQTRAALEAADMVINHKKRKRVDFHNYSS